MRTVITFRNKDNKHTFTRDFITMIHDTANIYDITTYNQKTREVEKFKVDLDIWEVAIM